MSEMKDIAGRERSAGRAGSDKLDFNTCAKRKGGHPDGAPDMATLLTENLANQSRCPIGNDMLVGESGVARHIDRQFDDPGEGIEASGCMPDGRNRIQGCYPGCFGSFVLTLLVDTPLPSRLKKAAVDKRKLPRRVNKAPRLDSRLVEACRGSHWRKDKAGCEKVIFE